jgi:DNA-binding winged helix-turn-helix (wHTH) protein
VILRLGDLTFNADSRQLLRGSTEVHVSPKAFELLKILLEERPRAISKQELHQRLWPSTFVTEGNLATLIGELREALGDSARKPRFLRTAYRFGYAFCGQAVDASQAFDSDRPRLCWLIKDGQRLPLSSGENVLGRDADGAIHIDSVTVSRRHARIVISQGGATLEDLRSKNGTFLGGQPISEPTALKDGDEIRTGSVVFRFRMPAPDGSTATWGGTRE